MLPTEQREKNDSPNIGIGILERIIKNEQGRGGYLLLWLLGVPLPILLIIYFIRGH